ncbi:MAG: hypothetical protein H0W86_00175 [Armatimonadetes bacterium]|nr:hypothetical protein [Armatimonadota bacterium]
MEGEALLGFSARLHPGMPGAVALAEELLTDRVPVTTDRNIWEDLFWDEARLPIPIPEWNGPNTYLWEDLTTLIEFASQAVEHLRTRVWIVGFSVVLDNGWRLGSECQGQTAGVESKVLGAVSPHGPVAPLYLNSSNPVQASPDWDLLGHDVADSFQYSAIVNMGIDLKTACNIDQLALLNKHLLFDSYDQAAKFRKCADKLAPAHAPFLVYRAYLIREVSCEGCADALVS